MEWRWNQCFGFLLVFGFISLFVLLITGKLYSVFVVFPAPAQVPLCGREPDPPRVPVRVGARLALHRPLPAPHHPRRRHLHAAPQHHGRHQGYWRHRQQSGISRK